MKRWLAKLLCPEVFDTADRYDYLRRRLTELQDWCGHEAPEIDHAITWAKKSINVHFMSSSEYLSHVEKGEWPEYSVGNISQFRQELRNRAAKMPAA